MIIFDLTCTNDHDFEGWFQSSESFDLQLKEGLISCPYCGSIEVRRVPSAIHLARSSAPEVRANESVAAISPQGELLSAYHKLVSAIMASSEDVGQEFVNEARKIHYLEAPARSIRGQATDKDFESLRDEGIEVLRLPGVKKESLN